MKFQQLLKLKIKNGENHFLLYSFFPAPNFFSQQSFTCFPTTTAGVGGHPPPTSPRIHSRELPKQKSHGEARFDDEEKDVDEARDMEWS